MPAFTRDEIKAALVECLGDGFPSAMDASGLNDEVSSKQELLRFVSIQFLQTPDAIFYLASLFRDDLQKKVDALVTSISGAREAVDDVIVGLRMPDIGLLDSASIALTRVTSALEGGKGSPEALARAGADIKEYADDIESQLVSGGSMSSPSATAKSTIQTAISGLQAAADDILVGNNTLLALSLDGSAAERLFLAATLSKIIEAIDERRTSSTLESEVKELYVLLRTAERIIGLKTGYPEPFDDRYTGTGAPSNSVSLPARTVEPAEIVGTESFPIAITPSNKNFSVEVNGVVKAVTLTESSVARIKGWRDGNFYFQDWQQASVVGGPPPYNFAAPQFWRIYVDGVYFEGTIAAFNYLDILAMANEIKSKISHPIDGGIAGYLDIDDDGSGDIEFSYNNGIETLGDHRIVVGSYTAPNLILGLSNGQDSDDVADPDTTRGQDGNRTLKLLADAMAEQTATMDLGIQTAAQVAVKINALTGIYGWADGSKVCADSLTRGDGARIRVSGGDALDMLGMWLGQEGVSSHRGAAEIILEVDAQAPGQRGSTELLRLFEGICTTVTGVGNENLVDIPGGVGASSGVAIKDKIIIVAGANVGAYRVDGVATDRLTLDRDQRVTAGPIDQKCIIVREHLIMTSTKVDALDSSLEPDVWAASLFGFAATKVWGKVSDIELDASPTYVRIGDAVDFGGAPHDVEDIGGSHLILSPLVDMNAGSLATVVSSADVEAYVTLRTALTTWLTSYVGKYPNYGELMATINRLLVSTSLPNRTQAKTLLDELLGYYTGVGSLTEILGAMEIRPLPTVSRLLDTLTERGSDRGRDLLRALNFSEFFQSTVAMSHNYQAFTKFVELLQEYEPVEAVGGVPLDVLLEDSGVAGVQSLDPDEDLAAPMDSYLEPDDRIEL